MKCQILLFGKNIINFSSAELAQRVVKVKHEYDTSSSKTITHEADDMYLIT